MYVKNNICYAGELHNGEIDIAPETVYRESYACDCEAV